MRSYFPMIVCLLLTVLVSANSYAAGPDDARRFVDEVGKKVLASVNSNAPEEQKKQQLRQMFSENVDMEWMGKFVLANGLAQATDDQKTRYLSAYKKYLLSRYTNNFSTYTGSDYTINDVKPVAEGQYTVGMAVKAPKAGQPDIQAGYRVRISENGQYKIIDIIIEGVSLITSQRSEFASALQKGGLDRLIEQLKAKT